MRGTLNQKKAIKLLVQDGWTQIRGGKHQVKMTKPGCRRSHFHSTRGARLSNWLGPGDSQAGEAKMKELHRWS
jgi:hypothetical protein